MPDQRHAKSSRPRTKARKSKRIVFGRRSRSALEKGDLAVRRRCGVSKSHKIRKWAAYRKLRASALVGPGCCRVAKAQPFRCCRAAAGESEQGFDFLQHLSRCLVFLASYARLWMLPGAPCRSPPSPARQAKPAARRKFRTTLRAAAFFGVPRRSRAAKYFVPGPSSPAHHQHGRRARRGEVQAEGGAGGQWARRVGGGGRGETRGEPHQPYRQKHKQTNRNTHKQIHT